MGRGKQELVLLPFTSHPERCPLASQIFWGNKSSHTSSRHRDWDVLTVPPNTAEVVGTVSIGVPCKLPGEEERRLGTSER